MSIKKREGPTWKESETLEEYVIRLIEGGQTEAKEFKALLNFYGREKLKVIWQEHLKKKGSVK